MNEFLKMFSEKNRKTVSSFSAQATELLTRYRWPGNVRELKNTIERAVVLSRGNSIQVSDLPKRIVNPDGATVDVRISLGTTLYETEKELIFKTLEYANNNKTRAAKILGISLKTLHNKLNEYKTESI
ncbi:MAG: helix-turn-helix domain-containing protein [bacterium]